MPQPPCNPPSLAPSPTWPTLIPGPDGEHLMARPTDFADATVYVASLQARLKAVEACAGVK